MSVTVGTSTQNQACLYPRQFKIFAAFGLIWLFFNDAINGNEVLYTRPVAGGAWTGPTVIRTPVAYGNGFSVWFDGVYAHYSYTDYNAAMGPIYYRRFTPQPDGSVVYSAAEQTAHAGGPFRFTQVAVGTDGYAYIVSGRVSAPRDAFVTRNDNMDGTWLTSAGHPFTLSTLLPGDDMGQSIVPLSNGRMVAVWSQTGINGGRICARRWTGAAWGAKRLTVNASQYEYWAIAPDPINDLVHLVFNDVTNGRRITHGMFDYATDTFFGENAVTPATGNVDMWPNVCYNIYTGEVYCFYDLADDHIHYRIRSLAGVWGGDVDWLNEAVDNLTRGYGCLNCFWNQQACKIGVEYTTLDASPWNIRYNELDVDCAEMAVSTMKRTVLKNLVVG